jgi:hypothetical protein
MYRWHRFQDEGSQAAQESWTSHTCSSCWKTKAMKASWVASISLKVEFQV